MTKFISSTLLILCFRLFAIQINLITPNGGEQYKTGQELYIQWFPDTTYNINTRISVLKSDTVVYERTSGTGLIVWSIPLDFQASSNYKIRVTDIANPANFDQSESSFSIEKSDNTNLTDSVFSDITENTIWTADTVFVLNNIKVIKNAVLTIPDGCTVLFSGMWTLTVEGSIICNGTAPAKIVFDANDTTDYWRGICFPERIDSDTIPTSVFNNCYFSNSMATDYEPGSSFFDNGGAIRAGKGNSIVVVDCEFDDDEAEMMGGAIYVNNSQLSIINALFHHNLAGNSGGAVFVENCNPQINNCTIIYNSANINGGALALFNSNCQSNNNIFWFNSALSTNQIHLSDDNSNPDFYNCNISGGLVAFTGSGSGNNYNGQYSNNLDVDPQITGKASTGSYHLLANSPCIDSGINDYNNFPDFDFYGNPRTSGYRTDIGAYEYRSAVGIETSLNLFDCQLHNYPNPFNPLTTISFQTMQNGFADLKVYNIKGEIVDNLLSKEIQAGSHSVTFNGQNLASGIYFCKLTQSGNSAMHKIVLTK